MESTGPNPKSEKLAEQLLAIELSAAEHADSRSLPGFAVTEKLRVSLGRLTGDTGYRSLLNRALSLARMDAAIVAPLRSKQDGSLEGLDALEKELQAGASTLVIAWLLTLLATLIGEPLTYRLMKDIWPELKAIAEAPGDTGETRK